MRKPCLHSPSDETLAFIDSTSSVVLTDRDPLRMLIDQRPSTTGYFVGSNDQITGTADKDFLLGIAPDDVDYSEGKH